MFFQSIMPVVVGVFDVKIKNGRIPCRILGKNDMWKSVKFFIRGGGMDKRGNPL